MDPLPWYRMAATPLVIAALIAYAIWKPTTRARATILGAGMLAGYGILQDQISSRLCPEYFTVLHNPIPGLTDPTLIGIVWGFLAAAGGGVAMGYAAGLAATLGKNPPLATRDLVRPMLLLMAAVAVVTAITGVSAHRHAEMFNVRLDPRLDALIPVERHRAAFTVACYHFAAYASAILGSVVMCVWIGVRRSVSGSVCSSTLRQSDESKIVMHGHEK
ncbi:hypothetical protein [Zavarzinella formosa]|uniref:hypothetical protein n=1 Tax=Zavarzinella formosa TaxID=360055 RepID=UPI000315867D|nr:hypothetical protein [Zavarzinella formosa]